MTHNPYQEALSEIADALGSDRGRRNETLAKRVYAIRAQRDDALKVLTELVDATCLYNDGDRCMTHDLYERPCPHEQARKLLGWQ